MDEIAAERTAQPVQDHHEHSGVLRFITAGSVDDGKSTLIGRLLHDSRHVLEDQLAAVTRASRSRGMAEVDLSLLTDGLEAEREQGITIDVAYRYFATARRKFIIADTPGHEQYTRNMATGASTAHAAIILADATRGLVEQGRRHLYIAHLLGVRDLIVAVNKMDLVGFDRAVFESVREAFEDFAEGAGASAARIHYIPLSALRGDMVVERGTRLNWYGGPTLLEHLETLEPQAAASAFPLRFPVQLVQRTPERGRAYLGRIAAGSVYAGQRVVVLPSGVETTIASVHRGLEAQSGATAGDAVSLTLATQVDVARGDIIADADHAPRLVNTFDATLVWLVNALRPGATYLLKHGTRTVKAKVSHVSHVVDVNTLHRCPPSGPIGANSIFRAELTALQPLALDAYEENRSTGAFILIDETTNQTIAAGMVS
ncbi:MAG: cysN [Betaproteobacteria bacterium]|nr:cysN [Betaproteobacteria bacterium]